MSGHSKWSTIKHAKGAADQARGKLFSKLSKAITVAVKTGGGPDPEANYKLRSVIDEAKTANMPKDNIERAIKKGAGADSDNLEEVTYEGFGPDGVGVLILCTTDNRNRTGQEIKFILESGGGSLGGPGSVSFNFKSMGWILLEKQEDSESQMLKIIDLGIDDVEESEQGIEAYMPAANVYKIKKDLEEKGYKILETDLVYKPVTPFRISDSEKWNKLTKLFAKLEDHEDVQKIFTNAQKN